VLQAPPGYVTPNWPGLYTPTWSVRRSNGNGTDVLPGNYLFEAIGESASSMIHLIHSSCSSNRYLAIYTILASGVPCVDLRLACVVVHAGTFILANILPVTARAVQEERRRHSIDRDEHNAERKTGAAIRGGGAITRTSRQEGGSKWCCRYHIYRRNHTTQLGSDNFPRINSAFRNRRAFRGVLLGKSNTISDTQKRSTTTKIRSSVSCLSPVCVLAVMGRGQRLDHVYHHRICSCSSI
jgi:hypothetical protein